MITIQQVYELAVQMGMARDPRGHKRVASALARKRKGYEELTAAERALFDPEELTNPYADTRLFTSEPTRPVRRIMVGIDITAAEVLLASQLGERGKPIDLVLSHHPVGHALANLSDVMHMQAEILSDYGVPINVAESMLVKRMDEVLRRLSPANHYQPVDAAQLLGMSLMCAHTATDNLVMTFMREHFAKRAKQIEQVGDVLKELDQFSEYIEAKRRKQGPVLFTGSKERFAGKIAFTEFTGGTSGAMEIYEKLSQAGVGTIVAMHMTEERKDEADKHHITVIVGGHMPSDSIGMNLFVDELERRGVDIIPVGGFIRVSRLRSNHVARRGSTSLTTGRSKHTARVRKTSQVKKSQRRRRT